MTQASDRHFVDRPPVVFEPSGEGVPRLNHDVLKKFAAVECLHRTHGITGGGAKPVQMTSTRSGASTGISC